MLKKSSTLWQVVIALVVAIAIGVTSTPESTFLEIPYIRLFSFLGQLFLNGLMLLVIPLVSSSIIHGISQMGQGKSFGRLGVKTFCFYLLTTLLAILAGVTMVNLIHPGHASPSATSLPLPQELNPASASHTEMFGGILNKLIPPNIFETASQGNMLGIIFFSIFFGLALTYLDSKQSATLSEVIKGVFHTLMKMTQLFMRMMPFGVFFLVVKAMASQGREGFTSLLAFFGTVLSGLLLFILIILPLLLRLFGLNPLRHFRAMAPALLTAFSTSSSAATLPLTMECVEKRAGVSNRICSFVVPLGTTVNMAGSALYECVAALFIAQVYGIDLTLIHQGIIVFLSLLTSLGIAGIPSGSLVAILIVLNAMGLPAEGLALILPVDRILDMCRTTVNVFSDTSCAVLVAHTEGESVLRN